MSKIAFYSSDSGNHRFINPIIERLQAKGYECQLYNNWHIDNDASILWFDFCDQNLISASRRLFSNNQCWAKTNAVCVDDAAIAPDESNDASTLVGTGVWTLNIPAPAAASLPAGTYTFAVWAKRNTGTDQVFRFSTNYGSAPLSSVMTATSTWQRFTYTFTLADPTVMPALRFCASDSTDANLQICDLDLFAAKDASVD